MPSLKDAPIEGEASLGKDLGLDSLEQTEVLMAIEEEFGVSEALHPVCGILEQCRRRSCHGGRGEPLIGTTDDAPSSTCQGKWQEGDCVTNIVSAD